MPVGVNALACAYLMRAASAATNADPVVPDAVTLYEEFGGAALALAFRIVGDQGIAEDVVQDAFLSAWKNAAQYDPRRGSVRTWLNQIVRHRAIDRVRGDPRRRAQLISYDDLTVPSDQDVLDDVLRSDEKRRTLCALAALPPTQRQAIELAYFGGYSQTEIAALTNMPLGTVKGRTRAALRTLAASLEPRFSAA